MYRFRGYYAADALYIVDDVVVEDGLAYACTESCSGIEPPERHHWQAFANSDAAGFAADAMAKAAEAEADIAEDVSDIAEDVSDIAGAVSAITDGKALYLASSTEGSTKKFAITVDDDGEITATELVAEE